jgi:anaphase-promoting complex subunit 3
MVLHANKKSVEALQCLQKAIEIDPNNYLARFKRGTVLASMGNHQVRRFFLFLCLLFDQKKKKKEALSELEALRDIAPKEPSIHFTLGKIYKKIDQKERALVSLNTAIDLDPKNSGIIQSVIDKLHQSSEADEELELK